MTKLLILGGGIEQVYAYELAHEMGIETIGMDLDPNAPGLKLADYQIIRSTKAPLDAMDYAYIFNKTTKIDGVMTIAHDVAFSVAHIAHALGLPGISVESAKLASDKVVMKWKFLECGVPTPMFWAVIAPGKAFLLEWGYPVIVKPVDNCGARGVTHVMSDADIEWACQVARDNSFENYIIVEEFVEGLQLSTESMMYKGKCYTVSISERNYDLERFAPYMIEDGGVIPARLTFEETESVKKVVAQAAKSLGIENGPVKGDIVMSKDGPMVIEMAARLSGGYLCTSQIPLVYNVNLVEQTIKLALGRELDTNDLIPHESCRMGIRYFFPKPGRVVSIKGFDELGDWGRLAIDEDDFDWVVKKMLNLQVGDIVEPCIDHTKRVGFVHCVGRTQEEAEQRAINAVNSVKIKTI
ncbi:hypothetical protein LCGC14_1206400 [marine sediment metagenome]|uniref:ATP-grasp domain-containing protein n=1 Tax=marine sediment metagenome TaxID=412755 RepID=A0A0F9LJR6_9ZZZZ